MHYPSRVTVVEVGPRDGLQNEAATLTTVDKIAFIDRLTDAGFPVIEAAAFVSLTWVPQMADAAGVFQGSRNGPTCVTPRLCPMVGLGRAHAAGVRDVAIFAAASETFSRRNINQSIAESSTPTEPFAAEQPSWASAAGVLSTAFGCPSKDRFRRLASPNSPPRCSTWARSRSR
jgi:hydroxymethylglutaryl-CoA lyase